jgi:hypothetical protein
MKNIFVLVLVLLLVTQASFSQQKFTVNIFGGYTLPVADLQGTFPDTLGTGLDFRKSKTLLTTYGINFGAQGKYVVDSIGSARITVGANYNSFTGSKDYSRPSGVITYKNKVNLFTLSAGAEYAINPKAKYVPFLGLDLAANFYGGKIEGSGDTNFVVNRKSETRFGIIAGGGVEFKLWKSGGIVLGVKYALTNLIGRESEISTTINPIDIEEEGSGSSNEIPLNDAATSISQDKSLNYVQFYLGISINFGKKLK